MTLGGRDETHSVLPSSSSGGYQLRCHGLCTGLGLSACNQTSQESWLLEPGTDPGRLIHQHQGYCRQDKAQHGLSQEKPTHQHISSLSHTNTGDPTRSLVLFSLSPQGGWDWKLVGMADMRRRGALGNSVTGAAAEEAPSGRCAWRSRRLPASSAWPRTARNGCASQTQAVDGGTSRATGDPPELESG